MSNQLDSAGHDLSDELWPTRLLAERPEAIAEAHLAWCEAGVRGRPSNRRERGHGSRERAPGPGRAPLWGAAPVGPYGAMLADGSECCGRYGLISACEPRSL